jgi:hypothetical protein
MILEAQAFPQKNFGQRDDSKWSSLFQNHGFLYIFAIEELNRIWVYDIHWTRSSSFRRGFFSTCVIAAGGDPRYRLNFMYKLALSLKLRRNNSPSSLEYLINLLKQELEYWKWMENHYLTNEFTLRFRRIQIIIGLFLISKYFPV